MNTEWHDVLGTIEGSMFEDLILGKTSELQHFKERTDGDYICYTTYYQTSRLPERGFFVKVASEGNSAWCEGVWSVEKINGVFRATEIPEASGLEVGTKNQWKGKCRLVQKKIASK